MSSHLLHELRTLVLVIVGALLAIVGAKMADDLLRATGLSIIVGAVGMAMPGAQRDPHSRTRAEDQERMSSGK